MASYNSMINKKLIHNYQKDLLVSSPSHMKKCGNMETIPVESKCIIKTTDGPICGYVDKTDEGTYYRFKSIPYAKPPLGSLRFLPPLPISPWTELKDCTQDASLPLQYYFKLEVIGSEDCLYMEVSTANIQPKQPLPVMFWIGAYGSFFNMDQLYDPSLLNARDVVFVRCGFRLGPFGFLSINDLAAPGNCGLKDLTMALTWVQRNISAFGGDPSNVTIFGSSTGGAIVHLMMLSPMTIGLFHKAIVQSASALNSWSLTTNPSQPVLKMAKILGIEKACKTDIIEELRAKPADDIMTAFVQMVEKINIYDHDYFVSIFTPCVEEEFEGQSAFLTRRPINVLKSGNFSKVPLLIGSNNVEAALFEYIYEDIYKDFENYNKNLDLLVPKALFGKTIRTKRIGQQLLEFYLGSEKKLTEDTKSQYLQILTDYYFLYYVHKTVRLHREFAPECPIYYYILNFSGKWFLSEFYEWFNSTGHNAEIPFIFGLKLPNASGSRDSLKTRERVVKLWTNFAKYGNPTPDDNDSLLNIKWDPVESQDKLNYLSIGAELTKGMNPFQDRMTFWDDLHKEHIFLRATIYFNDLGIQW